MLTIAIERKAYINVPVLRKITKHWKTFRNMIFIFKTLLESFIHLYRIPSANTSGDRFELCMPVILKILVPQGYDYANMSLWKLLSNTIYSYFTYLPIE